MDESSNPPRLRYLVITELFLPTKGGTAIWFDEIYRRLGDRMTHIVTAAVPGSAESDDGHPNAIHRVRIREPHWIRPASLPKYIQLFLRSLKLATMHRFDVVHAGRVLPEGLVAVAISRLRHLPLLIYSHGEEVTTWRRHPWRLRAMTYAYGQADHLIANSQFTRDRLLELGLDPGRITVVCPGVDIDRFRPGYPTRDLRDGLGLTEDERLVLGVGRLTRRKGFDTLIRALPTLRREGLPVHLAIIGIGDDETYLRDLAQEQGVAPWVHLLGHVSPKDLPRWYNVAEVFAMPNRAIDGDTEGFGMVFLEAGACGRPVIGGKAGGTADAIVDGETGFRVDGNSKDAVTAALRRMLTEPALASRMGQSGRARALKEFAWERIAEKTLALHHDLVDARARSLAR